MQILFQIGLSVVIFSFAVGINLVVIGVIYTIWN